MKTTKDNLRIMATEDTLSVRAPKHDLEKAKVKTFQETGSMPNNQEAVAYALAQWTKDIKVAEPKEKSKASA